MRGVFGRKVVSKIKSNKKYLAAVEFAQTSGPIPGKDYEWVIAHADAEYKRLESIGKELDTKANSFIRYSGLVVSALSLLSAYDFTSLTIGVSKLHILPAVILMLSGIVCAARATLPQTGSLPMATADAFKYADGIPDVMIARTSCAAMTYAASVGVRLVNEEKGRLIWWAFRFFIFALLWLVVVPLATSILGLICRG